MAVTYEAIANLTLSSQNNTMQISSIPSTYTDLRLIYTGQVTANAYFYLRFNNASAGGQYGFQTLWSSSTTNTAFRVSNSNEIALCFNGFGPTTGTSAFAHGIVDIFNYTDTNCRKSCLYTFNRDSQFFERGVGTFQGTSNITSIQLVSSANFFAPNSTLALYGILKA